MLDKIERDIRKELLLSYPKCSKMLLRVVDEVNPLCGQR